MEAGLIYRPGVFEPYFPPITRDPQFKAFMRRCLDGIREFFRGSSFKEEYLAEAQNQADLRRRMFQLQYPRYELPRCIW